MKKLKKTQRKYRYRRTAKPFSGIQIDWSCFSGSSIPKALGKMMLRVCTSVIFGLLSLVRAIGKPLYYTTGFLLVFGVIFLSACINSLLDAQTQAAFSFKTVWVRFLQLSIKSFARIKQNLANMRASIAAHRKKTVRIAVPTLPQLPAPLPAKKPRVSAWQLVRDIAPSFLSGIIITGIMLGSAYGVYVFVFKDLPSPRDLLNRTPPQTTKIYDRNGVLLYKIYKEENRTLVPLTAVPNNLKHAFIAIEDKEFYHHSGFSVRGIVRAVKANLEKKQVQGGSTITQQLVKNTLLSPEKTIKRKVREVVLSFMVESSVSKDEILEMYLNEVSFGGTIYGVEEASRRYFGKSVKQLSLAESAYLAGLPQAPSTYSPFGPHPELGVARQHQVLQRMVDDGYITSEESQTAKEEELHFQADITDIKAPHFVMYVRELLAKEYGEELVAQGGLEIVTSLDYDLQKRAEQAVTDELNRLKGKRVTNGAVVVTNPKTGEVLAMVGSQNYFDIAHDGQVNVTLRPRQPGSSIKPLTYAVAMERGFSPSTMIEDAPITYKVLGSAPYTPKNYDGRFHGRVSLRTALANSYNIPAVKLLATVGVSTVVEKGREMGITTWGEQEASRFGLSLTLGGGEVYAIDMASLYGTFANGGITTKINPIIRITKNDGKSVYSNPCSTLNTGTFSQTNGSLPGGKTEGITGVDPCGGTRSLSPFVAWQITDILKDNNARSAAFGLHSVLEIPKQQVAVKTGTTNSLRDNWTIGYTTDRVVVTWVGNNDNTPMSSVASGITGASPIWNTVMRSMLDENNPHVFAAPEGLIKVKVCSQTGTLPCSACPYVKEELFVPGSEPKKACTEDMFKPKEDPNNPTGQNQTQAP